MNVVKIQQDEKPQVTIRRVTMKDIPRVMELWKTAQSLSKKYTRDLDENTIATTIYQCCTNSAWYAIAVEVDGEQVGGMIANLVSDSYSTEYEARTVFVFIDPRYRGLGGMSAMVDDYIAWAQNMGAARAIIGFTNEQVKKPVIEMLQGRGFGFDGYWMGKNLRD